MKLLNDFYHIDAIITNDVDLTCKVGLNAGHAIYKAHFPGNPITPGVVLVQIATELISSVHGRDYQLCEAVDIKFRRTVTPDVAPVFTFTKVTEADGVVSARISIDADGTTYAKMSLKFREIEA